MNLSISNGGAVKNELYSGNIDFDDPAPNFHAILARSGFSFNSAVHKYLKNLKATLTGTMSINAVAKTISKASGTAYGTTGFVSGNICKLSYTDDASAAISSYIRLTSVSDDLIRFVHLSGDTETIATSKSVTITSNDEVSPCDSGSLSITVDASARTFTRGAGSFITDGFEYGTVFTTNSANNPGPYKVTAVTALVLTVALVGSAVIADETATMQLTNGYTLNGVHVTFTVDDDTLTLDPFDLSSFGPDPLIDASPGMIIYDDKNTDDTIICYASFEAWTLQF